MANRKRYRFTDAVQSVDGRRAVILAVLSAVLFAAAVFISFLQKGAGGAAVGCIGVTAILLAGYGFRLGVRSFREKDVSPVLSVAGSILSGIMLLLWLTMFLRGIG